MSRMSKGFLKGNVLTVEKALGGFLLRCWNAEIMKLLNKSGWVFCPKMLFRGRVEATPVCRQMSLSLGNVTRQQAFNY